MFTLTKTRANESDETRQQLEASRILTDCCEQTESCRFQLIHCSYAVPALFLSLHDDRVEIRLSTKEGDSQLIVEALCCISFAYGTYYCAFLGYILSVRRLDRDEIHVIVSYPKQLNVTNLRRSFRVPVAANSGLKATVQIPQQQKVPVKTCDITEGGIEIELDANLTAELAIGDSIDIELSFRDEIVQRTAEVRRIADNRCGLSFNNPADDSAQGQASQMRNIVLSLQQLWLRSRAAKGE